MATQLFSRFLLLSKPQIARASLISRSLSFSSASAPRCRSPLSLSSLLRPLSAASAEFRYRVAAASSSRSFATRRKSSLNDPNPNWSNRPPKETILLDGCDFEHWLVVMEKPESDPTRDDIIDSYIKTLAQIVGSEEEARMKIYSVSTRHYYAFGALVSEELSHKLKDLPRVRWVLPDSYLDVKNKDYGGEPFIDGQAVPYDPRYHEEWVRNNAKAKERGAGRGVKSKGFGRGGNMQSRDSQARGMPPMHNQGMQNPPPQGNMPPPSNFGGMPLHNQGGMPSGNYGGMPPRNQGGVPPNSFGGMPPNNLEGMPPQNNMGGMPHQNMGQMRPLNNMGGMPPQNNMGGPLSNNRGEMRLQSNMGGMPYKGEMPPQSNMGGMPPRNQGGVPPNSFGGMPPNNLEGMPPQNNMGGMPHQNMGQMRPLNNMGGMPPQNNMGGPLSNNRGEMRLQSNMGGMPYKGEMPPQSNMGGMPYNGGMPQQDMGAAQNVGGFSHNQGWSNTKPQRDAGTMPNYQSQNYTPSRDPSTVPDGNDY